MAIGSAGPIGRSLRLLVGACIMVLAAPVYLDAGWAYNLRSLALVAVLALLYLLLHHAIAHLAPALNRWVGVVLALAPVILLWFFGQGGGPLFGQGEGGTAAITYIGISLLIDFARGDSGCEVMAIPGLVLRDRTHLPCLVFSPIDALERKWRDGVS